MKRVTIKRVFLIALAIFSAYVMIGSLSYIYLNRGVLFDASTNGNTTIHLRIGVYFDKDRFKSIGEELVTEITQLNQNISNVVLEETNNYQVIIKTDFIDINKRETLTKKLEQKYGGVIEILSVSSMSKEAIIEGRKKFLKFIVSVTTISTMIFLGCLAKLKQG